MTNAAEAYQDPAFNHYPAPSSYDNQYNLRRDAPLYQILDRADEEAARNKPTLRMALSEIRDDLERRTREWRNSAKIVEQTLEHLGIAEAKRIQAQDALDRIEDEVKHSGQQLSMSLANFDTTGETKNLDARFAQSEAALLALDKATSLLLAAQNCCRAAWLAYSDALAAEELLRQDVRVASQPN